MKKFMLCALVALIGSRAGAWTHDIFNFTGVPMRAKVEGHLYTTPEQTIQSMPLTGAEPAKFDMGAACTKSFYITSADTNLDLALSFDNPWYLDSCPGLTIKLFKLVTDVRTKFNDPHNPTYMTLEMDVQFVATLSGHRGDYIDQKVSSVKTITQIINIPRPAQQTPRPITIQYGEGGNSYQ